MLCLQIVRLDIQFVTFSKYLTPFYILIKDPVKFNVVWNDVMRCRTTLNSQ